MILVQHYLFNSSSEYYVYILRCLDGRFYTGMTGHLINRMYAHITRKGAMFTRRNPPCELVHLEPLYSPGDALERESELKKKVRNGWRDFYLPIEFSEFFYRIVANASDKDLMKPTINSKKRLRNCHDFVDVPYVEGWEQDEVA